MSNDFNNSQSKNNDNSASIKKRKNPDEVEDQDDLISAICSIINKTKDISNTQIVKKKINQEIEKNEKNLMLLEKFEKIKNDLSIILNSSLFKKSKMPEIIPANEENENNRNTIIEYFEKNQKEFKPFYQSLNQENKKYMNNTKKTIDKDSLNEYLNCRKTILIPTNKNKYLNNIVHSDNKDDERLIKKSIKKLKERRKRRKQNK